MVDKDDHEGDRLCGGENIGDDRRRASRHPSQLIVRETGLLQECCGVFLQTMSWLIIVVCFPVSICLCLKIVQEYERAIIFRLGRALPDAKGPGLFFVVPCTDQFIKVDLRTVSFDIPPQEILTKDSVTVAVDAVVYYRISNPWISVINVENAQRSTQLLAQTTLRNILGMKTLSEILTDRESISAMMQHVLDDGTDPWGVQVERVEIKDVRLPIQLQRAMAAEAEATREAKAKVIAADGEYRASRSLRDASDVISQSSSALQLRYLQALTQISAEKNSTIIFPLPVEILASFAPQAAQTHSNHPQTELDFNQASLMSAATVAAAEAAAGAAAAGGAGMMTSAAIETASAPPLPNKLTMSRSSSRPGDASCEKLALESST